MRPTPGSATVWSCGRARRLASEGYGLKHQGGVDLGHVSARYRERGVVGSWGVVRACGLGRMTSSGTTPSIPPGVPATYYGSVHLQPWCRDCGSVPVRPALRAYPAPRTNHIRASPTHRCRPVPVAFQGAWPAPALRATTSQFPTTSPQPQPTTPRANGSILVQPWCTDSGAVLLQSLGTDNGSVPVRPALRATPYPTPHQHPRITRTPSPGTTVPSSKRANTLASEGHRLEIRTLTLGRCAQTFPICPNLSTVRDHTLPSTGLEPLRVLP
jgi:hypothetical protein